MTLASPSQSYVGNLVFGHGDQDASSSQQPDHGTDDTSIVEGEIRGRSMYVELFEEMLQNVVDTEPNLFDLDEIKVFTKFSDLSYPAKYLFIRLSLRKTGQWIKLADLKYESELGPDGIREAMKELCADRLSEELNRAAEDVKPNILDTGPEVIDLTLDEEEEQGPPALPDPLEDARPRRPNYDIFAYNEAHAQLSDLLDCLRIEELKELAKQMKAKPNGSNRDALVDALLSSTSTQQVLAFPAVATPSGKKGKSKAKATGPPQRTLYGYVTSSSPSGKKGTHQPTLHSSWKGQLKTAQDRLRELVVKKLVTCIKLNEDVVSVFRRVNLVYFRSTVPTPLLTPSILARAKKWSYAHQDEGTVREPPDSVPPSSLPSACSSGTFASHSLSTSAAASSLNTPAGSPGPPGPSWARTAYKLWPTRDALLRYEWALELEARVDAIFGMAPSPGARRVAPSSTRKGKERARTGSVVSSVGRTTPAVSIARCGSVSPEKERHSVVSAAAAGKDEGDILEPVLEEDDGDDSARVRGAKEVLRIFEEVWPVWLEIPEVREELDRVKQEAEGGAEMEVEETLVDGPAADDEEPTVKVEETWDAFVRDRGPDSKPSRDPSEAENAAEGNNRDGDANAEKWLNRFHYGHVLTRIVCKGTHALSILKKHQRELEVLEVLLSQRAFRRGRRGRWHDRRALILMTHCEKDEHTTRRAWCGVIEALRDEDTHIVWRPMLCRRLGRLQKRLRQLGVSDVNFVEVEDVIQRKAPEIVIEGERIYITLDAAGALVTPSKPVKLESPVSNKRRKVEKDDGKQLKLPFTFASIAPVHQPSAIAEMKPKAPVGKSIWRGRDGEEVNVETFALQHYEAQGYKGLHSEGRIVTTLFGLLFWDVIFSPVPGAFETPYQTAPLDIAEDTFYLARRAIANARLKEINDGKGAEVLLRTWDAHAEKKTFCVGVRWDLLPREDLVVIMECFSPVGLSVICRTLLEDYGNRTGGLPDLFVWHQEEKTCKFVEVKGPGDNLQENQKLWIDVLLQAKVPVEVCRVAERGAPATKGRGKAKTRKTSARNRKTSTVSPSKKRKRADDSDEEDSPTPLSVDSENEVLREVDYSQLDEDVSEELDVSAVERQAVEAVIVERETTEEAVFEEQTVEEVVVKKHSVEAVFVAEQTVEEVKREPRRSARPRKEVNYNFILPIDEPETVETATPKPKRQSAKVRKTPTPQPEQIQEPYPMQTSQELKKTQEIVTRPQVRGDIDSEHYSQGSSSPQTPRRRQKVEVVIPTPPPRKRKRGEPSM